MKRTKIVATIGPASAKKTVLAEMITAGMNVARLNFSHGDYTNHRRLIQHLRSVSAQLNQPIAIMQDLQGPRIRIGDTGQNGLKVRSGETVLLTPQPLKRSSAPGLKVVPLQYRYLSRFLIIGSRVLIDDGTIELKVLKISGQDIYCRVLNEGIVFPHKGLNAPGAVISAAALTAKDKKDLAFGLSQKVDYIALSFVKSAKDIIVLRQHINRWEKRHRYQPSEQNLYKQNKTETNTKIIAKIEQLQACHNIDEIIAAADGIMVARGDLGLEAPEEKVPTLQKEMIKKCNLASKPVIVATQMLNSMITNIRPTRAEVSDVANAVIDGADAVMLSAESASGRYPVAAVKAMTRIIKQAEQYFFREKLAALREMDETDIDNREAIGFAVAKVAEDIGAKAIIADTSSGITARTVASFRPRIPIYALSPFDFPRRQLNLVWGVYPGKIKVVASFETLLKNSLAWLIKQKKIKKGDKVVITVGYPFKTKGKDSFIRVHQV